MGLVWAHKADFNDTDGITLASKYGTSTDIGGGNEINSNGFRAPGSGVRIDVFDSGSTPDMERGDPGVFDQYAQFEIGALGGGFLGIVLRSDAAGNCYLCYIGPGSNQLNIGKYVSSSLTPLTDTTKTLSVGDVLRGEVEGATIRLLINGTEELSTTDSSHASGDCGVLSTQTAATKSGDNYESGHLSLLPHSWQPKNVILPRRRQLLAVGNQARLRRLNSGR